MLRPITYSPAYTLVPTYECFNRCTYCNFRANPGEDRWLSTDQARQILTQLGQLTRDITKPAAPIEILLLSGEVHPRSPRRQAWFQRIYDLCALALELGFLPHTNAGPLQFEEMQALKQVNVSMGLMLEQLTPKLLETVHRHAPSKQPQTRLQQLAWAGQLGIPFTTGLLLGIGETAQDWQETLAAIASLHQRYGHIQEVILQPHQPGQQQPDLGQPCDDRTLLAAVKLAREQLPADITLQIPPNLVKDPTALIACLKTGASDLGGIGPWDEVNPDYAHHSLAQLRTLLRSHGFQLRPRLPVYPAYDEWLGGEVRSRVGVWRQWLRGEEGREGEEEKIE
ncbi:MAG: 7,8-didemethyl-8-hydroxy-5-deazariboflavin synthase subunit CofG [Leptolyngbya sp. SIO4C1]|nr:7,8-didemethyl-8-hydroxy-5-deazariboflavin synthase subunit CofG [Leptolyngbya sp. SIO4C1]